MARKRPNSEMFPFEFPSVFDKDKEPPAPPPRQLTEEEIIRPSLQPIIENDVACRQCQASFRPKNTKEVRCEYCRKGELNPYGVQAKQAFAKGRASNISFSAAAVKSMRKKEQEAPGIGVVVNTMFGKFGSIEKFCESWYTSITAARLDNPGSSKVLRAHEVLAKFVVDANRIDREEEAVIVSRLSDEEVHEKLIATIVDQIQAGNQDMLALVSRALHDEGLNAE